MKRRTVWIGLLVALWAGVAQAACQGDCGGDGEVTIDELILGVNIALGATPVQQCSAVDRSQDGEVTVDEIIGAVNSALGGCPTGSYAGDYAATVAFDATHSGIANLTADAAGQVSGSIFIGTTARARAARQLSFTFPVNGVSVGVSGTYDPATGGFEVSGTFVDGAGANVPVVISGNLPAPGSAAAVNVYLGSDVFSTTLTTGMLPTPSPNPTPSPTAPPAGGQRLAYAGSIVEPHIFVINLDGTGKRQLTTSTGVDTHPAWSPDGTKLAFQTPDAQNRHNTIGIVNADGSGFHRIGEAEAFLDDNPAWSPDGTKIVFTAGGGDAIDIINADGSGRHRLVTKAGGESYGHMSWSPDGSRIAVESTRPRDSGHVRLEIWVMNADGTNFVRLTNNEVPDRHPAWSPDGSKILFGRDNATVQGVFAISPNGGAETRLINDPFFQGGYPDYSQDGQQIAYPTLFGIKITNAAGANGVAVPNTQFLTDFDLK